MQPFEPCVDFFTRASVYHTNMTDQTSVPLSDGRELVVELWDEELILSVAGVWEQRLTREEAWELAEALDALATRSPSNHPDESRS